MLDRPLNIPHPTRPIEHAAYDDVHDVLYVTTGDGIAVYEKASLSKDVPPTRVLRLDSDVVDVYRDLYYDKRHDVLYLESGNHTQPLLLAFARPAGLTNKIKPTRTIPYGNFEGFAVDTKRNILYTSRGLGDSSGGSVLYTVAGIDTFDDADAFRSPNGSMKYPPGSMFPGGGRAAYGLEMDGEHDRLYYILDGAVSFIDNASLFATGSAAAGRPVYPVPVKLALPAIRSVVGTIAYDAASDRLYVLDFDKLYEVSGASKLTAQSTPDVRTITLPAGMSLSAIALP